MARVSSKGQCHYCQQTFTKGTMTKHLTSCSSRKLSLEQNTKGKEKKIYHIIITGYSIYWLHLELPADFTLHQLDHFLRGFWLECCGHLSQFTIGGRYYSSEDFENSRSDNISLSKVVKPGDQFKHEYDMGSTTELTIKVASERSGFWSGMRIKVLAQNIEPEIKCSYCDSLATQVCCECVWDDEGWLCDDCAEDHECGEEMLLPVVNSPRVGVCAYCG